MGESLKDGHRTPRPLPGDGADKTVTVKQNVPLETPPVQPVPPPPPVQWVPWSLHH